MERTDHNGAELIKGMCLLLLVVGGLELIVGVLFGWATSAIVGYVDAGSGREIRLLPKGDVVRLAVLNPVTLIGVVSLVGAAVTWRGASPQLRRRLPGLLVAGFAQCGIAAVIVYLCVVTGPSVATFVAGAFGAGLAVLGAAAVRLSIRS
jgi:hypothetical protein